MKLFPTGRFGVVLVVCGIAASLGSVLTRFIENLEEHLAAQDSVPVRSTAMIRPSDLHVSSVGEPVEPEVLEALPPAPLVSVPEPEAPRAEKEERREYPEAPRWTLWFPKVVYDKPKKFTGFVGGASRGRSENATSADAEQAYGSLGGTAGAESETFGACTAAGGESGASLQHGVAETAAGASSSSDVFAELNDWRGMPASSTSTPAGSGSGGSEGPIPLGGGAGAYRGSYYATELHLGAQDEPGQYEFAVLTDQSIRLETQVAADRWETLIEGETTAGGERLLCSRRMVRMQRFTWAPLRLSITSGGTGSQSMAFLWRRVTETSRPTESLCGSGISPGGSAGPSSEWAAFFRRGWSVVPSRNLYLPGSMESTECATAGSASGTVADTVGFGSAEGDTWTCTGGVVAARVGGQLVMDFGSATCTGADGSSGGPGMTSCWLTPPSGLDAQAFVDRVRAGAAPMRIRAAAGSGGCVDVREVSF